MQDLEARSDAHSQYIEQNDDALPLPLYYTSFVSYANEAIQVEKFKIACGLSLTITAIILVVIAATRGCVFNCKN